MSRDELAIALEELADAIRELGEAIDARSRSTTRPNPLSPPSVTDVLRAADEVAIPALITLLEAQIRTLRYLQRGSRVVRRGKAVDDRVRGSGPTVPERYADPDVVLDRLGSTLDQIGRRLDESADEETRDLFDRTRSLYEEIDGRLADYERRLDDETDSQAGYRIDISEPSSDADATEPSGEGDDTQGPRKSGTGRDTDQVDVDVDAELETLREHHGPDQDAVQDTGTEDAGSADPADERAASDPREEPGDGTVPTDSGEDGDDDPAADTAGNADGEADPDTGDRSETEDGSDTDGDAGPSEDGDRAGTGGNES